MSIEEAGLCEMIQEENSAWHKDGPSSAQGC
jgi:hypothetical protein